MTDNGFHEYDGQSDDHVRDMGTSMRAYFHYAGELWEAQRGIYSAYLVDSGHAGPIVPTWEHLPRQLQLTFIANCVAEVHSTLGDSQYRIAAAWEEATES